MITVFYDGKCGLCSKEINHYKTIANPKKFTWLDVANNPNYLKSIDVNLSDALMQLHVLDNENNIHVGVDAFIIIWSNLKFWCILSFIVRLPIIKQIANLLYKKFAEHRFAKLPHCQLSLDS